MKRKWSILIEYDAENLAQFENAFFFEDSLSIDREWVKGIMMVEEGEATNN